MLAQGLVILPTEQQDVLRRKHCHVLAQTSCLVIWF